jgi:hypothetical protein
MARADVYRSETEKLTVTVVRKPGKLNKSHPNGDLYVTQKRDITNTGFKGVARWSS